jgi:hypothetical protein
MTGGEGYLELARTDDGVLIEHLVKIAEPEKEDRSRVELLYFEILPKHRRGGFHCGMNESLANDVPVSKQKGESAT